MDNIEQRVKKIVPFLWSDDNLEEAIVLKPACAGR